MLITLWFRRCACGACDFFHVCPVGAELGNNDLGTWGTIGIKWETGKSGYLWKSDIWKVGEIGRVRILEEIGLIQLLNSFQNWLNDASMENLHVLIFYITTDYPQEIFWWQKNRLIPILPNPIFSFFFCYIYFCSAWSRFKLKTKIGLNHPPTTQPPQTFRTYLNISRRIRLNI